MKLLLTGKAFVWAAVWITIGVMALVSEIAFVLFLVALPLLAGWIWFDLSTLVTGHFRCVVRTQQKLELDQRATATWQFVLEGGRSNRVRFFLPPADLVRFTSLDADLRSKDSRSQRTFYECDIPFVCQKLGKGRLPTGQLRVFSKFGFWTRLFAVNPAQELRVHPSSEPVPEQEFIQQVSRQSSLFQGARILMRHRSNDQFYTVRRYQYPDPFRTIDQKKSARYQKLMTRVYDSHQNHHLIIGLDLGRSMTGRIGESQKSEFYISAALNLAQNALQSQDQVSFFAFSQDVSMAIRGARSLVHFQPLVDGATSLAVRPVETNYELMGAGIRSISNQRCIVMILADLTRPSVQESILAHLPLVAQKHLTVLLTLIDKRFEIEHVIRSAASKKMAHDDFGKMIYSYWLQEEFQRFRNKAARCGSGVMSAPEKHWLDLTRRTYALMRESLLA